MKIFNWVHRKFHHKDGFGGNVKKSTETECQVLLENVTLVEVLGGWRDGILTIGTFGFDPSTDFDRKNECPLVEKEEEEEDDDDDDGMKDCDDEEEQSLLVLTVKADLRDYEVCLDSEELEGDTRKKKRITLADLFVADSDLNAKPDCGKVLEDFGKKVDVDANKKKKKKGFLSAKKFIPGVGDDTSPIKKLRQLMKRMMKRKIHPGLEEKFEKMDSQMKPTTCGLIAHGYGTNESVSLLQTKDSIV
ncbi:hypothetical protein LOK49_LG03G02073 [Camellia lanceoleosa]|uniref:Uncharacterized protein n=1 Tax=Camellia lanceoleosa TaxID=1840588 RepID=A0ACC0IF46_9ERIC|nr:hypothetical protein LOK49_LG03G02073 [Camellia lanceoleosa]